MNFSSETEDRERKREEERKGEEGKSVLFWGHHAEMEDNGLL